MRLTLRTLLAYLDDTLDPAETKLIGQKVAESDAAQELIARIKQVTRRRRLTTPPATGPNSFEPNTVADYLDNTLSPEQVAEVEKACLESDVHLAEIAAAHQILTLVLGQPALVPPTAKRRMYALVHGRKPARPRATAAATPNGAGSLDADARAEEDETLLLGLPFYRRQAAMRWLLPLAGVLLLAALGLAVWHRLPSFGTTNNNQVASNEPNTPSTQPTPPDSKKDESPKDITAKTDTSHPPPKSDPDTSHLPPKPDPDKNLQPAPVERPDPPSEVRRTGLAHAGAGVLPGVLLHKTGDSGAWTPIKARSEVSSRDLLVSLPGFQSDIHVDNDVKLTLWGSLYEYRNPYLESAVMLYAPPKGFDADFKLDRGAVLIKNQTAKSKVRIRFFDEVWDVELEQPSTEVGVMILGMHREPYGSGEPPLITAVLVVRKGQASARFSPFTDPVPLKPFQTDRGLTPVVVLWNNKGKGVSEPYAATVDPSIRQEVSVFENLNRPDFPDQVKQEIEMANKALDALSRRLSVPIVATLNEIIQKAPKESADQKMRARLAVRCLGALDSPEDLVSLLDNGDVLPELRHEAIITLRHWIGRNAGQELQLYDPKNRSGVLSKAFSSVDSFNDKGPAATTFIALLHSPNALQLNSPSFWSDLINNLNHPKLAIRELAFFHLRMMLPNLSRTILYDPNADEAPRKKGYEKWKELVDQGKLPPRQRG